MGKEKTSPRQRAYITLVFAIMLALWLFKGWRYGVGFFLGMVILGNLFVLVFGRKVVKDQDEK